MASRSVLHRHLLPLYRPVLAQQHGIRLMSTKNETKQIEIPLPPPPPRKKSWLTHKVETSPTARYWFMKWATLLGYNSPKQIAGRYAFIYLREVVATAPDIDPSFWKNECDLPPTFQTWFTVANLHLWLLTVRLRALSLPHGKRHVQFLLDHFFLDVEDRIRAVLQPPKTGPPREPYTFFSSFYVNPNAPAVTPDGKPVVRGSAPERLVVRQMKIFREQYMGMSLSFDHALIVGDMEMAAAVWRNLLGARGARGIEFPDPSSPNQTPKYRRSVNLIGGDVEKLEKIKNLDEEEAKDDGSGVHDYAATEADKYVKYPEVMLDVVGYLRRELVRLENVSDEDILDGHYQKLIFGPVRQETKRK
ncbi:hypothetical protein C8J56DRAFT_364189 [Mycena floridula]|nr:hypothetical protein C8J56DRAFT_364189 [Mycena floridula]